MRAETLSDSGKRDGMEQAKLAAEWPWGRPDRHTLEMKANLRFAELWPQAEGQSRTRQGVFRQAWLYGYWGYCWDRGTKTQP